MPLSEEEKILDEERVEEEASLEEQEWNQHDALEAMLEDPALLSEFPDLDLMSSTATCRYHMGRRELTHAAHISHDVLPIASLLRRHGMSDAIYASAACPCEIFKETAVGQTLKAEKDRVVWLR